ncbi:NUDIX hydrolase [Pseudomonas lundensis]|uniref:NUDIX domain-containing protein n=1 Tax=Pseudomonas lundensis TaxID=86185 RepID=UPI001475139F|nr:NUDIX hydrolase [Pseudomonas lundensis]NNA16268.1 NUDIX hydrolase [Pseudomonas lundensis]
MEPISVKVIVQGPQGGLFVKNPRGEWELPGGRPEAGESLEQALVREVQEECGLTLNHMAYVGRQSCEVIAHKRVLLVFFYGALPDPQTELCLSEEHTEFG